MAQVQPSFSTLHDQLIERLGAPETVDLEYKLARHALPKSLWETVSAFANTAGGWIVLGAEQTGRRTIFEGVANPSLMLQEFYDLARNPQKISGATFGPHDVGIESLGPDGRPVIIIRVRATARNDRPVFIIRYRQRYQHLHPESVWSSYDDVRFLRAVGAWGRDPETNAEGITVAGVLMFGTLEAIRDWRGRQLIDYQLLPSRPRDDGRWDDRVAWIGNLMGAFEEIYPRLIANQPVPFRLENAVRVEQGPMQIALRESLINLLVHADYAERDASLIQRSADGYYFRNLGSSRVPEDDLWTRDRSDPRNPRLVQMFRFVGLAEEAGRGMSTILTAWRQLGFRFPTIEAGAERYEFSIELRYAHFLSQDDRDWLQSLGEDLSEAQQLALVLTRYEVEIDNPRLSRMTGLHPADVTKLLRDLRSRGLLAIEGVGRGARYRLDPAVVDASRVGASSTGNGGSSTGNGGSSTGSETDDGSVSAPVWSRLEAFAATYSARKRLDPDTRDRLIVQLCSIAPLSRGKLAQLIGRSEGHMRNQMQLLVNQGRLTYLHPGEPTHPRQRYVAVRSAESR